MEMQERFDLLMDSVDHLMVLGREVPSDIRRAVQDVCAKYEEYLDMMNEENEEKTNKKNPYANIKTCPFRAAAAYSECTPSCALWNLAERCCELTAIRRGLQHLADAGR